jgi:hypothetical protein
LLAYTARPSTPDATVVADDDDEDDPPPHALTASETATTAPALVSTAATWRTMPGGR